ncbi:MAG: hypothetical protein V1872_01825 [bacterium]
MQIPIRLKYLQVIIIFSISILINSSSVYARELASSSQQPLNKRLIILPFENLSNTQDASKVFREALITRLTRNGDYILVNDQEVEDVLLKLRVRHIGYLSSEVIKEICKSLEADQLLIGSILSYSTIDNLQVSVRIQMINVDASGSISLVKDIIKTNTANDYKRVLGLGKVITLGTLVDNVANQVLLLIGEK